MADAQEFLSVFGECLRFLCYFRLYFPWNHWENARITITHVFYSALTFAVSLGSSLTLGLRASGSNNFLEPRQMLCMNPIIEILWAADSIVHCLRIEITILIDSQFCIEW